MHRILPTILLILLFASAVKSQGCAGALYDGFESGAYTPTWLPQGGPYTWTVTTTSPAVGTYSLQQTGGASNHNNGLMASFPLSQPSTISWYAKSGSTGTNDTYFLVGDANITTNYGICVVYFASTGNLRFIAGSGNNFDFPYNANQWYFIEMRNINYSTAKYDIWIDGILRKTGQDFRTNTVTQVDRVSIYNWTSGSTGWYDEVTVGSVPILTTLSGQDLQCAGDSSGSINLTVGGGAPGYTYNWSNGSTNQNQSGVAAGSYTVTVTDTLGCTATDSITISEPAAGVLSLVPTDLSCNGDNSGAIDLTMSGGTPGYSYSWSSGDSTEDLSGLSGGTYAVVVQDSNGCMYMDSVVVSEPAAIVASAIVTDDNGSNNGAIDLTVSGGTPGYSYAWSNGDSTEDVSGLAAGDYIVVVTDSNGCSFSDTFTVSLIIANAPGLNMDVEVYPNPFRNQLIVDLNGYAGVVHEAQLTDLQGRKVMEINQGDASGKSKWEVNTSNLSHGMYLLRIKTENGTWIKKLAKR